MIQARCNLKAFTLIRKNLCSKKKGKYKHTREIDYYSVSMLAPHVASVVCVCARAHAHVCVFVMDWVIHYLKQEKKSKTHFFSNTLLLKIVQCSDEILNI